MVHPSSTSATSTANGDSEEEEECDNEEHRTKMPPFVRDNYVFDAYLLGFCDDVSRALAKKLFQTKKNSNNSNNNSDNTDKKAANKKSDNGKFGNRCIQEEKTMDNILTPDCGGRLLSSLLEGENNSGSFEDGENNLDHCYDIEEWRESITVPPERVLLFPGAVANADGSNSTSTGDENGERGGTTELTYREIAHCDGCSKRIFGTIQKCAMCFDYDLCSKCFPRLSKTHFDGMHKFISEPAAT